MIKKLVSKWCSILPQAKDKIEMFGVRALKKSAQDSRLLIQFRISAWKKSIVNLEKDVSAGAKSKFFRVIVFLRLHHIHLHQCIHLSLFQGWTLYFSFQQTRFILFVKPFFSPTENCPRRGDQNIFQWNEIQYDRLLW